MIKDQIMTDMKTAMRERNAVVLETLRYILSQIKYVEIDKQRQLTEDEVLGVLSTEVKKRRDAIKLFRDSGRDQLVTEEEEKLKVITSLLPAQLSAEEIEKLVDSAVAKVGKGNFGAVMKELMPQVRGKADGSLVSEIVKKKI